MMSAEILHPHVTATQFLTTLFRDLDDGWLHLFALDRTNGERQTVWRPATEILGLTAEARRLADRCCIWFGAAPRRENLGGRRGGSDECVGITAAWVDLDVAGPNHVADNLPPDHAAARLLLADYPLPPSVIVDTGGGIQAWWLLAEPLERDPAEEFLARWGATWAELGAHRQWHVDNVFDIARILRLPATWNRKGQPQPVSVTDWEPERRYGVDDLDQWCIEPPRPAVSPLRAAGRKIPYIGPERPGDAFNAAVDPGKLLEGAGFVFDHQDRAEGASHFRAPHHASERGVTGATVYADGHTTIWSETFAGSAGLKVKRPYDPFGLYTHLRHAGDWRAASDELARRGYGTKAVVTDIRSLTAPDKPDGTEEDGDWSSIDLAEIARRMRDGNYAPITPTVLAVAGSMPLFYIQRINSLFGESGGGKTWVALAAVAEVARAGERALFIDYEDNPNGITERLVMLGLTDAEIARVDYRNPTTGIGLGIEIVERAALDSAYSLVVIDSTGEAMAAGGVDSNADAEVARWFAVVKGLARLKGGPAVVVLDHVPKAADAPSSFAIGSQRKRAAVTGAAYRVDTLKEPSKGRNGKLKLTVVKDRPGNRGKGVTAALVELKSIDGTVELDLHLTEAQAAEAAGARWRPTVYMERVSRWVEDNPGTPKRRLVLEVQGKRDVIEVALEVLVDEGWLAIGTGPRQAVIYTVTKPFRELDDAAAPVDNSTRALAHHRAPAAHCAGGDDPRTRALLPTGVRGWDAGGEGLETDPNQTTRAPVDNPPDPEELF